MNLIEEKNIINNYNTYLSIPDKIDIYLKKLEHYIKGINDRLYLIEKLNHPDKQELIKKINNYLKTINEEKTKLLEIKSQVITHINNLKNFIFFQNFVKGNKLGMTDYIFDKIRTENEKMVYFLNFYKKYIKIDDIKKFIKTIDKEYQKILDKIQGRGLTTVFEKTAKGLGKMEKYLKYTLIITGLGIATFYLFPFLNIASTMRRGYENR